MGCIDISGLLAGVQQRPTKVEKRAKKFFLVPYLFTNVQDKQDISSLLIIFSTTHTFEVLCFQLYLLCDHWKKLQNGGSCRLQPWEEKLPVQRSFYSSAVFFMPVGLVSVNCWCNSATFEQINRLWHRRMPFLCMTVRHWKIKTWQLACVKANIGQPWLSAPSHCCCSPAFYIRLGGMWGLFRWWRLCC